MFSSVVVLVSFLVFVFVLSYVHWFFFFGVVCVCVRVPGFFDAGFLFYLLLVCVFFPGFPGFCLLRVWMGLVLPLSGCVFVDVLCCCVLLFWWLAGRPPSVLPCSWSSVYIYIYSNRPVIMPDSGYR